MIKQFDVGIYTFRRQVAGQICPPDDQKTKNGSIFAVLHPMQTADPKGLFCFGVSKDDLNTKTLVRRNLKFNKIVTLSFSKDGVSTDVEEIHAKLGAAVAYFKGGQQLMLTQSDHPRAVAHRIRQWA